MSSSAVFFSYFIGAIFAIGGVIFLVGLDENRLLFGIPYLVLGVVILGDVAASQRRGRKKKDGGGH